MTELNGGCVWTRRPGVGDGPCRSSPPSRDGSALVRTMTVRERVDGVAMWRLSATGCTEALQPHVPDLLSGHCCRPSILNSTEPDVSDSAEPNSGGEVSRCAMPWTGRAVWVSV
jgi:hypothetical protein